MQRTHQRLATHVSKRTCTLITGLLLKRIIVKAGRKRRAMLLFSFSTLFAVFEKRKKKEKNKYKKESLKKKKMTLIDMLYP